LPERVRLVAAPGGLHGRELAVLGWTSDDDSGEIVLLCRLVDGSAGEIRGPVDGSAGAGRAAARGRRCRFASGVAVAAGAQRAAGRPARSRSAVMTGGSWPVLSGLDARVLRATDARYERSPEKIGQLAGCAADVAVSTLRRLRVRSLVEDDGERPQRWLRTHGGDVALEHTP
jgi:hypothetical protein